MAGQAVFNAIDGRFVATELARGPWDPDAQHGGAPAALLMRCLEALPAAEGLRISRVTYDFLRPVPLGSLSVEASATRRGRRVQVLEASVSADGADVVRARALQVQAAVLDGASVPPPAPPPTEPLSGRENDFLTDVPMFSTHALEIRFVHGAFYEPGPATAWFRLRHPIVAGEDASPLQRLAAAGDFGNGISAILPWDGYVFINPDLTLYIEREPLGEWIGLRSQTRIAPDGIGTASSVLYDQHGRVGTATQALLVAPR